jgi:hypothetical protein
MRLYLDCEFNEFQGDLISMALVAEDDRSWYEVLPCENPGEWVARHVIPIIEKSPVSMKEFQSSLQQFLMQFETVHIVADWPEDIQHFCQSLITGPGERLNTPPLTMEVVRIDSVSDQPHNALADARGIKLHMCKHQEYFV